MVVSIFCSCSSSKTVYISNKTGSPITLLVDSSYDATYTFAFKDSLHGLRIAHKKVLDYGKGKWAKEDKTSLEELIKHTRIIKDSHATAIDMPSKTRVSHISLTVEELWVTIK